MRVGWDTYFLRLAYEVATRSTCDRAHVGAVIVRDHHILATGYNGSVRGTAHCDTNGHVIVDGHCVRTVHAEMNAVAQAGLHGTPIKDATIYCTHQPCWNCLAVLANAGIDCVMFAKRYGKTWPDQLGPDSIPRMLWMHAGEKYIKDE